MVGGQDPHDLMLTFVIIAQTRRCAINTTLVHLGDLAVSHNMNI